MGSAVNGSFCAILHDCISNPPQCLDVSEWKWEFGSIEKDEQVTLTQFDLLDALKFAKHKRAAGSHVILLTMEWMKLQSA